MKMSNCVTHLISTHPFSLHPKPSRCKTNSLPRTANTCQDHTRLLTRNHKITPLFLTKAPRLPGGNSLFAGTESSSHYTVSAQWSKTELTQTGEVLISRGSPTLFLQLCLLQELFSWTVCHTVTVLSARLFQTAVGLCFRRLVDIRDCSTAGKRVWAPMALPRSSPGTLTVIVDDSSLFVPNYLGFIIFILFNVSPESRPVLRPLLCFHVVDVTFP